jgi:zinc/manganese transport system substrate-binding protein
MSVNVRRYSCSKTAFSLALLAALYVSFFAATAQATVNIVAAENIYGSVIKQLGGPYVNVFSILNNPNQDPHFFSVNPGTAVMLAEANIIVYNGAGYDAWINPLLTAEHKKSTSIMAIADIIAAKPGANPHLWYKPETMPAFAKSIAAVLSQHDPQHQNYFIQQLHQFNGEYQLIFATVKQLNRQFNHVPVLATEPVFNYMAQSIGLQMQGMGFQESAMNDTPPTIMQMKEFEDCLRQHTVKILIYNNQVSSALTRRMLALAQREGIAVVGVSEMLPPQMSYTPWMMQQLLALEKALQK